MKGVFGKKFKEIISLFLLLIISVALLGLVFGYETMILFLVSYSMIFFLWVLVSYLGKDEIKERF